MTKYKAKRTFFDEQWFDSGHEAKRWAHLQLLVRSGYIRNLKRQVTYVLSLNGVLICKYVADFVYFNKEGNQVVEDAKGYRTREYKLKAKLMLAIHGISILET